MSFFFPVKLCSALLLRHQTLTTQDAFFLSRDRNFFMEWRLSLVYNPPIKKYKVSNQKVQKRGVFFAPRFLYPFHTSKGGIFAPFDRLLYFLEGRRVGQIEHDDLIAACLHCGTAAAEGGNRIAQRLTLEGIV